MARSTAVPLHLRFGEFELDEANARLSRDGKAVALAPTPFNLLCALARRAGQLMSKDALLDAVWGHQFVSESVLKTAISDLRIAMGDNPREPRFIETVARRGYRFIANPVEAPVAQLTEALQEPVDRSFIGRVDALARLRRHWDRAREGQRAIVWVAGEPGIGKTTLIEHFAASLTGAVVARGQCVEHYGSAEAYLPVLEALAEMCRKDSGLPGLLRSVAPTWLLQLPWLCPVDEREALHRELAGVGPERMLREMGELLDRYTEHRPLLLVTEDLHWSDRSTLQLIDHVARRRSRANLMWLASFRVAEVVASEHSLNPLRRELRLHRLCDEIILDPFSETEVAGLVSRQVPHLADDEAFVRRLHERTDGVPLFVASVMAEVAQQGDSEAAARLAAEAVPDNVAAIIEHHMDRLDPGARGLLSTAAVCGVEFRIGTLALALKRDVAAVAADCDELVRGRVWLVMAKGDEPGSMGYAFRHTLFRQVLYDRTPQSLRWQLHRNVGEALLAERAAGVGIAPAELATHFDRGRLPLAALRYYAEAADASLRHFSPAVCITLTERALVLLPQAPVDSERDELEITLSTLQGLAAFQAVGVGEQARTAFERAYRLLAADLTHPMRSRLLHGLGYLYSLRGDYVEALVVAKRAEILAAESGDRELMLVACFLHGEVHHLQGRTAAAREWLERGLDLAESLGDAVNGVFAADPQVALLGMLAIELVRCGLMSQGRALAERARARAMRLRQPMTRLVAVWQQALLEVRLGSAERLVELTEEMHALVQEFDLAHGHTAQQWFRGWAEARRGRPTDGYRLIREAYEHNLELGMKVGASELLGYAAEALLLAGDVDGAQAQLQQALQVVAEQGERVYLPQLLLMQATVARARGQAASVLLRQAVDEATAQGAPWLELQARLALCLEPDATSAERVALAILVESLPEMAESDEVRAARALLAGAAKTPH